jgi:hypothetical protein
MGRLRLQLAQILNAIRLCQRHRQLAVVIRLTPSSVNYAVLVQLQHWGVLGAFERISLAAAYPNVTFRLYPSYHMGLPAVTLARGR